MSGACGDGTSPEEATAVRLPVTSAAAGAPGTALGDGFTVADGTILVGDPLPTGLLAYSQGEPGADGGWTAMSIVDGGDPTGIVDEYMAQAARAGLDEQPGKGCARDLEVTICWAFARSPGLADLRSFLAAVVRGPRGDVYSDHVVVRYATSARYWEYGNLHHGSRAVESPAGPVAWPPLAGAGDPLGTAGEMGHEVTIQEGSRLVAPARLNLDDVTGGVVAMLEVTGNPASVLGAYLDSLASQGLEASPPRTLAIDGAVVTNAVADEAGGDSYGFTIVERPGRPTWLRIEGSHD